MMKFILKEDRGYALVTVLLIITVFSILALAFMTQSISSMKQNKAVEEKAQSVELAEMGATYFQHAITNKASTLLPGIISKVNQDIANKPFGSEDDYTQAAIASMAASLKNDPIKPPPSIQGIENASFTIKEIVVKNTSKEIVVTSDSTGSKDGKEFEIEAKLTINFENFLKSVEDEEQEEGNRQLPNNLPTGNEIQEPNNLTSCDSNLIDFSNKNCLITDDKKSFGNNTNDVKFNNSKVKTTGSLEVNGNMNNTISSSTLYIKQGIYFKRQVRFDNTKLYVGGIPNFDESASFSNNSIVYFEKEADFKFNFSFSNSDMYAAEGIYFKKPSIIENQSNVYVKNLANFDETIDIKGGSNVYFGSADFKKNFTLDNSNLYINNGYNNQDIYFKETADIRNGSDLYIGGHTYFKKNFKLSGSTLYIDGNAKFDDTLDFSNNAKMCVNGHLDIKHNANINNNDSSKIYAKTTNHPKVNTTNFSTECNQDTTAGITILGKIKISPNFDYTY